MPGMDASERRFPFQPQQDSSPQLHGDNEAAGGNEKGSVTLPFPGSQGAGGGGGLNQSNCTTPNTRPAITSTSNNHGHSGLRAA